MKKWERFTRQEIEQFVEESSSYAQLAKKFDIVMYQITIDTTVM